MKRGKIFFTKINFLFYLIKRLRKTFHLKLACSIEYLFGRVYYSIVMSNNTYSNVLLYSYIFGAVIGKTLGSDHVLNFRVVHKR